MAKNKICENFQTCIAISAQQLVLYLNFCKVVTSAPSKSSRLLNLKNLYWINCKTTLSHVLKMQTFTERKGNLKSEDQEMPI